MSNVITVATKVTLKEIVDRSFLETMFFSDNTPFGTPLPSELCRKYGKGRHWTNECKLTRNSQGNPLPLGNSMRGLLQDPMPNLVQFYAIIEETPSQSN